MKLILTPAQSKIWRDPHRFKVIVAGRRFGKTTLSLAKIIKDAADNPNPIPQAFYWYIAPTFGQAEDIAWKILNDLCDGWNLQGKRNETDLVRYVNNIPKAWKRACGRGWIIHKILAMVPVPGRSQQIY